MEEKTKKRDYYCGEISTILSQRIERETIYKNDKEEKEHLFTGKKMHKILDNKHYFFLLLAILGGGLAFYFALLGIIENKGKFNSIEFITSTWVHNYYSKSLTLDFWTGTIAGTFFILIEGIRLNIKRVWLYLFLTICVAYAFGFPLFLFIRELKLKQLE
jgi:hypothetical protein